MRADHRKLRAKEEERTEAILSMLPASHPVRTMPELARKLEEDRDTVNRAFCSLADYGYWSSRRKTKRPAPTPAAPCSC
jgi:predicted transcriptional regulator